jgi:hypothetical protein
MTSPTRSARASSFYTDTMQKLADEGKTQDEIAKIFSCCQGTVAQTLKAGKLEKKYKEAVCNGDLERDAAIVLANLPTSDSLRTEIFEKCISYRQRFTDIMAKREYRKSKKQVAAKKARAATCEDVREIAKGKGVKGVNLSPRNKDQLIVWFEVMAENEKNPLPKSASDLIRSIEAYLDSDVGEIQLESAFRKCCVPDSK